MYATDFEYDKKRLSEFRMILCSFDNGSSMESISSGADITYHQEKSSGSEIFNLQAHSYESPYSATFQICKDPCRLKNPKDMYLTPLEVSELQRWLCRKSYHPFKMNQDNYRDLYWNAVFTSKQININGGIAGLELTMYTNTPYAYHDEIVHEFDFSGQNLDPAGNPVPKYFHNISDVEGHIYPDLEIRIAQNGGLNLSLNGRRTEIANCRKQEIITIKGSQQIISTSDAAHEIAKDFNFVFPRMEQEYEENKNYISADLRCGVTLKYSPIVLTGL